MTPDILESTKHKRYVKHVIPTVGMSILEIYFPVACKSTTASNLPTVWDLLLSLRKTHLHVCRMDVQILVQGKGWANRIDEAAKDYQMD